MANDQGAVELAAKMKKHLEDRGYEVNYLGIDHEESIDYPDQAEKCCNEYLKGGYEFGVVLCGTGIGISMAANKIKGIRCALVQDKYSSRKQNSTTTQTSSASEEESSTRKTRWRYSMRS